MSIATWKKEFQPVPPKKAARQSALAALRAEHRIWQGTTRAAMRKHGVEYCSSTVSVWDERHDVSFDSLSGGSPLCLRFFDGSSGCADCPIVRSTGNTCLEALEQCTDTDTRPMRRLVARVLREWERMYGGKR